MFKHLLFRRGPLMLLLVGIVACSGKNDPESLRKLTNQNLVNALSGDRKTTASHVHLMGLAYLNYLDSFKKSPKNLEELKGFYSSDQPQHLEVDLRDRINFVWDARLIGGPGGDNIILCYERNADKDGNRLAVTGKAELRLMNDTEFQSALKAAQGK
jgi:hypothetical protein